MVRDPETKFQYSGGGYVLAQKIVTDICKQSFCDLMNELVFLPAHMAHSTFSQPLPKDKLHEIAFGYNFYNLQLPGGYNTMPELSAAGLWSTPSDLARFGIEVMKALRNESTFIEQRTAELMTTQAYENSPYGIGFDVAKGKRGPTFGHRGSNWGYHSSMVFCPDDGTGIVVMQNSDIGEQIRSEVTGAFKEIYGW